MKLAILTLFFTLLISMNCRLGVKIQKVSAQSTFEAKKEVLNCEGTKQTLIETNTCNTKGEENAAICKEYEEKLKKELDCKMECKEFYKKYYKLTIETKEKQAELCKKNKKEDDRKSIEFEIEQIKQSQDSMIEMNCMSDNLFPDEEQKKKDAKKN